MDIKVNDGRVNHHRFDERVVCNERAKAVRERPRLQGVAFVTSAEQAEERARKRAALGRFSGPDCYHYGGVPQADYCEPQEPAGDRPVNNLDLAAQQMRKRLQESLDWYRTNAEPRGEPPRSNIFSPRPPNDLSYNEHADYQLHIKELEQRVAQLEASLAQAERNIADAALAMRGAAEAQDEAFLALMRGID